MKKERALAVFNQEQQQQWEALLAMQQETRNSVERAQQETRALFEQSQSIQKRGKLA
jgi:hypothetical protein